MEREEIVKLFRSRDTNRRPIKYHSIENLTTHALAVLGIMWSCRPYSTNELAAILETPETKVRRLVAAICRSNEPAVLNALAGRFPVGLYAELELEEKKLFCRQCGQRLSKVPCCKCIIESASAVDGKQPKPREGLRQSSRPTSALPGTPKKKRVMQERAARGLSVFCDGDPVWHDEISKD